MRRINQCTRCRIVSKIAVVLEPEKQFEIGRDGHALRISRQSRAATYLGMDRIGQVVCGTGTRWETSALRACLRSGIPIVFVRRGGQVRRMLVRSPDGETFGTDTGVCTDNLAPVLHAWFRCSERKAADIARLVADSQLDRAAAPDVHDALCLRWHRRHAVRGSLVCRRSRALLAGYIEQWVFSHRPLPFSARCHGLRRALADLTAWATHERMASRGDALHGDDWQSISAWISHDEPYYESRAWHWVNAWQTGLAAWLDARQ